MQKENSEMKKAVAGIAAIALLTGCASMSDRQQTTAEGAGMGAILGAVAGGIIGHQSGSGMEGALIGGLVGGLAGGAYGNHVANKKEEFASQEEYLDACISQAQETLGLASNYNEQLRTDIANLEREAETLTAAVAAKEAEKKELVAMQKDLGLKLKDAEESLAAIENEIKVQSGGLESEKDEGSAEQLAALEEQIRLLEEQKTELTEHTNRLASINNRISV
jgi:uncharacterized protein YcfJ